MKKVSKALMDAYARFVVKFPWLLIFLVILITGFLFVQSQNVNTVSSSNEDALPDDIDVIVAFDKISDKFGNSDSAMIVIQLDPDQQYGVVDVRDPLVMQLAKTLGDLAQSSEDVAEVSSAATLLSDLNDGLLPKTSSEINELIRSSDSFDGFISSRYDMTIISLTLSDDYDEMELFSELESVVSQVIPPAGVKVNIAGEVVAGAAVTQTLGSDMGKTSMYSMLGIIIVLFIVFRSLKLAFIPLATIGIGVMWTMGYIGLMRMNMSSTTSGVISMIMGIGIDFGIQIVSRFRQERRTHSVREAMRITLNAVFVPMTTTTLAAVIGFKAMGLGQLTFLAEMGQMMTYGVVGCYAAAILLIPAILVLFETVFISRKKLLQNVKGDFK